MKTHPFAVPETITGPHSPVSLYSLEYTDTFAGAANYSWARRHCVCLPGSPSLPMVKRRAKLKLSLTGCPGKWATIGEILEFRPYGSATILFVQPEY